MWSTSRIAFLLASVMPQLAVCGGIPASAGTPERFPDGDNRGHESVTIACYYYPGWHYELQRQPVPPGMPQVWSEWDIIRRAVPRFPGHTYPRIPQWGYEDESNPGIMERKIAAAEEHGVDVFIFDWYLLAGKKFLAGALDRAYLKARNNERVRFAILWCNTKQFKVTTPAVFEAGCARLIRDYLSHPCYWCIEGAPYVSFFDPLALVAAHGDLPSTRAALNRFRKTAQAAGVDRLHLNAVIPWRGRSVAGLPFAEVATQLGVDSVTTYSWIQRAGLPKTQTDYRNWRDAYLRFVDKTSIHYSMPYFPNVSLGWDRSPRYAQDCPFTENVIVGNSPERFGEAVRALRQRVQGRPVHSRVLTLYAWNEWGEGAVLEPDTLHRFGYLEALRDALSH